jgi:uncharacterized protein involved in type VI secretion and phage assembly
MLYVEPVDELTDARLARGLGGRMYGVYPALVTDNQDPDGQGRVRIKLPWSPDTASAAYEAWARLATMMAGRDRGTWFIPEPEDEVLIAFEAGDPRHPIVVGALWNGRDTPPESMSQQNNIRSITSRNGIKITMDDSSGQEKLIVETPGGQKITMQDGPGQVEIVDSNGNSIKMQSSGITIEAAAQLKISASTVEVSAGMVTVNAGMSKFSGVVQSSTVITNSVVSSSYTPGAGNIW